MEWILVLVIGAVFLWLWFRHLEEREKTAERKARTAQLPKPDVVQPSSTKPKVQHKQKDEEGSIIGLPKADQSSIPSAIDPPLAKVKLSPFQVGGLLFDTFILKKYDSPQSEEDLSGLSEHARMFIDEREFLRKTGISEQIFQNELMYLRMILIDYSVARVLGESQKKKEILEAFYIHFCKHAQSKMDFEKAKRDIDERLDAYQNAFNNSNGNILESLGKVFVGFCGFEWGNSDPLVTIPTVLWVKSEIEGIFTIIPAFLRETQIV